MEEGIQLAREGNEPGTARSKPAMASLCLAAVLNLVFSGVIQEGPLVQKRLVDDRGLSWAEAEFVFSTAFTVLTIGILIFTAAGGGIGHSIIFGLLMEAIGLACMAFARHVWQIAVSYGFASLGGVAVYVSSLQLCAETGSPVPAAIMSTAFNASSFFGYLLALPALSLDAFLLGQSILACATAGVLFAIGPTRLFGTTEQQTPERVSLADVAVIKGFRSSRYWAFCAAFAACTAAMVIGIGCFDAAVVGVFATSSVENKNAEAWLLNLFPLALNASFLSAPLLGLWAKRSGWLGPILVQLASVQLFLCCLAWPSEASLILALPCANLAQAAVYLSQGAYLATFSCPEFSVLLLGTFLIQSLVQLASNALGPNGGASAAQLWLCLVLLLGCSWPVLHWRAHRHRFRALESGSGRTLTRMPIS
ncbi:unnamed protein product [Polarella glacialis]|uniref:Uncharacterized protein n=1 Tax=Polarella glacialis TaxID=89957 RepID=A0A813FXW5_POLGL|nr:unnamed protein product [Polarella glacialis]CAE8693570.1 unnamed protein product [Polarella glacialis]